MLIPPPFSLDSVFETFATSEDTAIKSYNDVIAQLKGGKIGFANAANQLETGILPGWGNVRATLKQQAETSRRDPRASPKQLQLLGLLDELAGTRAQGWERMAAALRASDGKAFVDANHDFNESSKRIMDELNELRSK
jgi:hypothetical protein